MIKIHQLSLHKIAFNNPKTMGDGLLRNFYVALHSGVAYSSEMSEIVAIRFNID